MNILIVLEERYIQEYYGLSDLSTGFTVKKLLENTDKIRDYFSNSFSSEMESVDDYIDLIWLKNMVKFDEALDGVIKEKQKEFSDIMTFLKSIEMNRINELKYISDNYKQFFSDDFMTNSKSVFFSLTKDLARTVFLHHDFFDRSLFEYLEANQIYLILSNFELADKYYEKNLGEFRKMFEYRNNNTLFNVRNFVNTFNLLNKSKKAFVHNLLETKSSQVIIEVLELAKSIDEDNYIENQHFIDQILSLFNENNFSFKEQYELDNLKDKIKGASDKYFRKHGHKFESEPIDFNELKGKLAEGLKGEDSFINYISLTHTLYKGKLRSNFLKVFSSKSSLIDSVSSSVNTDDYFTQSRLVGLNMHFDIYSRVLYLALIDVDLLGVLNKHILMILEDIDRNESKGKMELVESYNGVFASFISVIRNQSSTYSDSERYECYTVSMFLVSLIEKMLRRKRINLYSTEYYFNDDSFNLGDLLRIQNKNGKQFENRLKDILDFELVRVLEYKLSKTYDTNIGDNIRNNLMHNRNIRFSSLSNGFVLHVFYLFISTINGIYCSYLNHNNEVEKQKGSYEECD